MEENEVGSVLDDSIFTKIRVSIAVSQLHSDQKLIEWSRTQIVGVKVTFFFFFRGSVSFFQVRAGEKQRNDTSWQTGSQSMKLFGTSFSGPPAHWQHTFQLILSLRKTSFFILDDAEETF